MNPIHEECLERIAAAYAYWRACQGLPIAYLAYLRALGINPWRPRGTA